MILMRFLSVTRRALPKVLPLLRNTRVPFWLKAVAAIAALLVLSPLDLFGDIPILGVLDDALLLALVVNVFVGVAFRYAYAEAEPRATAPIERTVPVAYRRMP